MWFRFGNPIQESETPFTFGSVLPTLSEWMEQFRAENLSEPAVFQHETERRVIHLSPWDTATGRIDVEGFSLYDDSVVFVAFTREFTTSGTFVPPVSGDTMTIHEKTWTVNPNESGPSYLFLKDDHGRKVFLIHTTKAR